VRGAALSILLGLAGDCTPATAPAPAPALTTAIAASPRAAVAPALTEPPAGTVPQPPRARVVSPAATPGSRAFVDRLPPGGRAFVGPLPGNGDRDVLVLLPRDPRPSARVRLVYHFHGTHAQQLTPPAPELEKKAWVGWDRLAKTVDAIAELSAAGPDDVALVYPLSAGKRIEPEHTGWSNKEYDRMWMRAPGESFADLHRQVRTILIETFGVPADRIVEPVLVEGHSAGGMALLHVARSAPPVVGSYLFLDASFQDWADGAFAALEGAGSSATITLVITDGGIADPLRGRDPWCVTMPDDPERAADWPRYRDWCAAMADDMRAIPRVTVHRTKVPHGEQPRRFAGGLGLPP
jgi:hypothetical protein